jgi:hypothetical protein
MEEAFLGDSLISRNVWPSRFPNPVYLLFYLCGFLQDNAYKKNPLPFAVTEK